MDSKLAIKQLLVIRKLIRGNEIRLASNWPENWQILISTILSAQTRDETTIPVCEVLFSKYPSIESLSKARVKSIEKIIRRVNYHRTKARHVLITSKMLCSEEIPQNIDELLKFPGVGRKVANVYLVEAHDFPAIGVDTHVKRISYKLGWTNSHNPLIVERDLEKLFPKKYWRKINDNLVRFGKSFGLSRKNEDELLENLINS
jgi:endonuclease-3